MNGILKPKPKPKQKPEPKPKTNRKQTVGTPYFISLLYNMAANPPLTSLVNDAVEDDSNSEMDYDSDATIPLPTPAAYLRYANQCLRFTDSKRKYGANETWHIC